MFALIEPAQKQKLAECLGFYASVFVDKKKSNLFDIDSTHRS